MDLTIPDDCLAFFVDDTGHELLNDHRQKVFGLGGCAVIGSNLDSFVRDPWRGVRLVVAGRTEAQLHAAELTTPTVLQINAVSNFFKVNKFARFGAICSVETDPDHDVSPLFAVAQTLMNRVAEISKWQPFRSIEIVFEHSQRLAPKIEQVFGSFELFENGKEIPLGLNWMEKAASEPALEVADFLANAIGTQVRHRLAGRPGYAKNFEAFFHGIDPRLCSFMDVSRVVADATSPVSACLPRSNL